MGALRGAWSPRPISSNTADAADAAFLLFAGRLHTGATAPGTVMANADSVTYLLVSFVMDNMFSKMSAQLAAENYSASLHRALQAVREYLHQPNQPQRNHSDMVVLHNPLTGVTAPGQTRQHRAHQRQPRDSSSEGPPWPPAPAQLPAPHQPAAPAASFQFFGEPGPGLPVAPQPLQPLHQLCYPQGHAAWPAPASHITFMHPCQQNFLPYAPYALVPAGFGAPQVSHLALSATTSPNPSSLIGVACSNVPHTWSSFSQTATIQAQLQMPLGCWDQHHSTFLNYGNLSQPTTDDAAQGHQLPSCWTSSYQNDESSSSSRIHIPSGHAHPDSDDR